MRSAIVVLLSVFVFFVSTAQAAENRAAKCEELVDKAVTFVQKKGTDYALKVFNCSKGPFIDRDLYVFVLSLDNVMLAHPYQKKIVGKSVDEYSDEKGNKLFQEFKKVVLNGGEGWVEYWWAKPGESGEFAKRSFVKRVPGQDIYLGAGYYK